LFRRERGTHTEKKERNKNSIWYFVPGPRTTFLCNLFNPNLPIFYLSKKNEQIWKFRYFTFVFVGSWFVKLIVNERGSSRQHVQRRLHSVVDCWGLDFTRRARANVGDRFPNNNNNNNNPKSMINTHTHKLNNFTWKIKKKKKLNRLTRQSAHEWESHNCVRLV
jgi:hypothetical protein